MKSLSLYTFFIYLRRKQNKKSVDNSRLLELWAEGWGFKAPIRAQPVNETERMRLFRQTIYSRIWITPRNAKRRDFMESSFPVYIRVLFIDTLSSNFLFICLDMIRTGLYVLRENFLKNDDKRI